MGSQHLTLDEKTRVRTLHADAQLTELQISEVTGYGVSQIRRAILAAYGPRNRKGPGPALTAAEEAELVEFITASRENRQLTWRTIATLLFDGKYGKKAIKRALQRLGYKRYRARPKPVLTEQRKAERKAFAAAHKDWTEAQWAAVLWSDETWVTYGLYKKLWITRLPGEEYNDDCVVDKIQRKAGWMFWGSFSGAAGKGPGVFWEKKWGFITGSAYREHIVPVVHDWIQHHERQGVHHVFMQDNAPGYRAAATLADFDQRGIQLVNWPAYSPDLNPIENVWNWMKDYIDEHYGNRPKPSYEQLRVWVIEAWEAVPEAFLQKLVKGMSKRCKKVYEAGGAHIEH